MWLVAYFINPVKSVKYCTIYTVYMNHHYFSQERNVMTRVQVVYEPI